MLMMTATVKAIDTQRRKLEAIVDRTPDLDIYLLKWSGGALIAPGGAIPALMIKLMSPEQIHLAFDGRHPIGACHHQKIAVIDDSLAFCGGIDMTEGRWDTREHKDDDPRRTSASGKGVRLEVRRSSLGDSRAQGDLRDGRRTGW